MSALHSYRPWIEAEDDYLRANMGRPYREIAVKLKRTPDAVERHACRLGLTQPHRHRPWTKSELCSLAQSLACGTPAAEVAARLGRTVKAVHRAAARMRARSRRA